MDDTEDIATREHAMTFRCEGETLVGILHQPLTPADVLVVVVVGGPQYRVGSHRQFVHLARNLAAKRVAVLRFDYRGLGDSEGTLGGFEAAGPDIRAAIDAGKEATGIDRVVLWGLCDAATAIAFYAAKDRRVAGIVLANPWVRSAAGEARAYLGAYYLRRLVSRAFLAKLLSGRLQVRASLGSLIVNIRLAADRGTRQGANAPVPAGRPPPEGAGNLAQRVRVGLAAFDGPMLILTSDDDLTAAEFRQTASSRKWRRLRRRKGRTYQHTALSNADHTFARPGNTRAASDATLHWLENSVGLWYASTPNTTECSYTDVWAT